MRRRERVIAMVWAACLLTAAAIALLAGSPSLKPHPSLLAVQHESDHRLVVDALPNANTDS